MTPTKEKDKAQKERAKHIRHQITDLKAGKKAQPSPKHPMSPREFIDQQMERESKKTPKEK